VGIDGTKTVPAVRELPDDERQDEAVVGLKKRRFPDILAALPRHLLREASSSA
jgi:hypothetical protein